MIDLTFFLNISGDLCMKINRNMKIKQYINILLLLIISLPVWAQRGDRAAAFADFNGTVSGKVLNEQKTSGIEYANVVLYNVKDSSMITGTISDKEGNFLLDEVPAGKYYLEANFIGYQKHMVEDILVTPRQPNVTLDPIILEVAVTELEGAEIVGNKNYVEYKIDKKVVNVAQHVNASGGTASDVLENVPGVKVDLEGNVELRGSSNFTVLIDGRPTIMEGSDALNQLPASAIQNIEIITNPSAKYDPDGTAGIINIIMKKKKMKGTSGVINASASTSPMYSGDILLNHRSGNLNLSGRLDYGNRTFERYTDMYRETYLEDDTTYLIEDGTGEMFRNNFGVNLGADYGLSEKNTVNVSLGFRNFEFGRSGIDHQHYYSKNGLFDEYYLSDNGFEINISGFEFQVGDIHRFNNQGHELKFDGIFNTSALERESPFQQLLSNAEGAELGLQQKDRRTSNDSDYDVRVNLDYSWPFTEGGMIEAGYQMRMVNSSNEYDYLTYDENIDDFINDDAMSNEFDFSRNIQAVYFTYSNTFGKFDIKAGLRTEYTDRLLNQITLEEEYIYESLDLYPSAYITRKFGEGNQLQASYSRRINRPRDYFLNPYVFSSDGFSSFTGNPNLEPDFANSYELNYQKRFQQSFVSVETYFRQVKNKMTRTLKLNDEGIMELTMDNLDQDYSLGIEMMGNFKLTKWWTIVPSADFYKYHLEGAGERADIVKDNNNWNLRLNSQFTLKTQTRIDLTSFYRSPSITVDGTRDAMYFIGLGARQEFFKSKLTVTARVQDVLDSRRMKFTSEGENFYSEYDFRMRAPIFMISLSYKLNNYRPDRRDRGGYDGNDGGGGMDMMM